MELVVSRIPWTRYEGDDVEAFAALCLYRDHPTAVRIRPSRGDGGIDVYVHNNDSSYDIYQVKRHAETLTSKQKRDIEHSYRTLKAYAAERQWTVRTWHLLLPLDPTPENDEWLADLNSADPFAAKWDGLPTFDNWAADYPQVVDYYFADGVRRLDTEMMRFMATTLIALPGVDVDAAQTLYESLEPAQILERVSLMSRTINEIDPHYSYVISTGPRATPPPAPTGSYPALVATSTREVGDEVVTVHILAKFAEAVEERPVTVRTKVVVTRGSAEEREWRQFLEYGRTPLNPVPVRDLTLDLPGGLASTHSEAQLIIQPADSTEPFDRVLSVISPDGETLAAVTVRFTDVQFNHDRTGGASTGMDATGMLRVQILTKISGDSLDVSYHFSLSDDVGRHPQDVLNALMFVNSFYAPNSFRISFPHIPRRRTENPLTAPVPDGADFRRAALYMNFLSALVTIQRFVDTEILVPDARTVTADAFSAVVRAARLLEGDTVQGTWTDLTIAVVAEPPAIDPERFLPIAASTPLQVTIGEKLIELGTVRCELPSAAVTGYAGTDADGDTVVTFTADPNNDVVTMTWEGETTLPPIAE